MGIVKAQSGVESRPRGRGRSAVAIGDYRQNMREGEGDSLPEKEGGFLLYSSIALGRLRHGTGNCHKLSGLRSGMNKNRSKLSEFV